MPSIPEEHPIVQAPTLTTYRFALKVTPEGMKRLSHDQLLALCVEQYIIISFMLAILRNPVAAVASRIVAIELFICQVEKTVKQRIQTVTEKSPVCISGDHGIAKNLGMHANTISKSLNSLEKCRVIERDYRFDEATQREHLDITLTPLFLSNPRAIRDKSARKSPTTASIASTNTSQAQHVCSSCGGNNIHLICADCGVDITATAQIIESTLDEELLHKTCVVMDNNAPQAEEVFPASAQRELQPSLVATDTSMFFSTWLAKRIGHGKLIYATGLEQKESKYKAKPQVYAPDYAAYLRGDLSHILGSYLADANAKTMVLVFDLDEDTDENGVLYSYHVPSIMTALAIAGAAPVYWERQGKRGHLEIYFDSLIDPDQGRAWCIAACPLLAGIVECYPAAGKKNQPVSWPLYQRKGESIFSCAAQFCFPAQPAVITPGVSMKNPDQLAAMLQQATTRAELLTTNAGEIPLQNRGAASTNETPRPVADISNGDLVKIVIAEFNQGTTWDAVVALCGGFNRERKFCAVWRGEQHASVAIDPDEAYACDYGRTGEFPKKLDKYEVWTLAQGGKDFKRHDLATRIKAYRSRQAETTSLLLQEIDQPQPQGLDVLQTPQEQQAQAPLQPNTQETPEEVITRLKGVKYLDTPLGRGRVWRLWPTQIGVVLDSSTEHVTFFKTVDELRAIVVSSDQADTTVL